MKTTLVKSLIPLLLCASAGAATINATGRGWYDSDGYASLNDNYQTGAGSLEHRSWFTFNLSSVTTPVTSASLVIFQPNGGFDSSDNADNPVNLSEIFRLYDVSSTGLIANGSSGHTSIFTDLGSGQSYGSLSISAANDGTFLTITLNANFLAQINANLGGTISMGGVIDGVDTSGNFSRYSFSSSNTGSPADGNVRLDVFTAVPEPSAYGLIAGAAGLALVVRRRIRNRRTA